MQRRACLHQTMMALSQQYRELDDAYLQARYIDVEDIMHRTLGHLTDVTDNALFCYIAPS
jgi:PTS hybrid protein